MDTLRSRLEEIKAKKSGFVDTVFTKEMNLTKLEKVMKTTEETEVFATNSNRVNIQVREIRRKIEAKENEIYLMTEMIKTWGL